MEYKYIDSQELRNWWAAIKPGLEKIKSKSPENWIIEDVYTDCFNQRSYFTILEAVMLERCLMMIGYAKEVS